MLSNCMMPKTRAITNICRCTELTDTLNIWGKKFIMIIINTLSTNFTKWSETLKQFIGNLPTNCLSVFDYFVGLALKGIIMFYYFEIFIICQESMRSFSKHYFKCKTVSIKIRKILQERRLAILKFSQDKPQNDFLNFLTSKKI